MNENKIIGLLELIVPQILKEIKKVKGNIDFDDIYKFYNSKLYSELSNESTKMWHYSPLTLYNMYSDEINKGKYEYPEES